MWQDIGDNWCQERKYFEAKNCNGRIKRTDGKRLSVNATPHLFYEETTALYIIYYIIYYTYFILYIIYIIYHELYIIKGASNKWLRFTHIFQAEDKRSLRSSAKTLAGHRIICQVKCCRNTGCRKIFAPWAVMSYYPNKFFKKKHELVTPRPCKKQTDRSTS